MDPQLAQVMRAALEPVPEVLDAWVFGSHARGDAPAGSDVDVVLLHEAPPLLARRVMRDGVLVFTRDEAATTRRVAERLVRWWDWKPVQDWIGRARMERARARAPSTRRWRCADWLGSTGPSRSLRAIAT